MRSLLSWIFAAWVGMISIPYAEAGPFVPKLGETVTVTSGQLSSSETATISFAGLPGHTSSLSVYSGPDRLSGIFGPAATPFSNLLFYCTDLYDYSAVPAIYSVGYLTSSHQPSGFNDLTTVQVNNIATLIAANHGDFSATQLAIWKVEYSDAFSFKDTPDVTKADVASYLSQLDGTAPVGLQLYQLHADGIQGMAYVTSVPEPATVVIFAAGLLGLCWIKWRRPTDAARVVARARPYRLRAFSRAIASPTIRVGSSD